MIHSVLPSRSLRYLLLLILITLGLHLTLPRISSNYNPPATIDAWKTYLSSLHHDIYNYSSPDPDQWLDLPANTRRANATFLILCRNGDLNGVLKSVKEIEDRFNRKYHYPYVFLNDQPFTYEFIKYTSAVISSKAEYGLIPREHWVQPDWIDESRAAAGRQWLVDRDIIYGDSVSYRNMCRFNSGFFYRHELMQKYEWYWRIEPDVNFFCDINYDPFVYMEDHNKVYGFTITMHEYWETIPTLWARTREFMQMFPEHVAPNNSMQFITDDGGVTYNGCHYWSNFEIASLKFWRGQAYTDYFDFLEGVGGFYYERWGDAPVHSLAVSLFANRDQIHFFNDIGYEHSPYKHCPLGVTHSEGKCWCDQRESFDMDGWSCLPQWKFRVNEQF